MLGLSRYFVVETKVFPLDGELWQLHSFIVIFFLLCCFGQLIELTIVPLRQFPPQLPR